jgi:hypothetical protein
VHGGVCWCMVVYGGIWVHGGVWWCMVVHGCKVVYGGVWWCNHTSTCGGIGVAAPTGIVEGGARAGGGGGDVSLEVEDDVSCVCVWCRRHTFKLFYLLPIFSIATVRNMFLQVPKHSDSVMRTLRTNHTTISHFRF